MTSSRSMEILPQKICDLPAHKANLEELLSRQGCKHAYIMASVKHLNQDIFDGEGKIEGFDTQRKDRPNGKGGGIVVYITETLTSQRRFDLEAVGIECI